MHQYHMLLGVTHLHHELSMPPRVETDDPLHSQVPETPWFSKLKTRRVTPNPTKKKLQVTASTKFQRQSAKQQRQLLPIHTRRKHTLCWPNHSHTARKWKP